MHALVVLATAGTNCTHTIDSHDPVKGPVRAGDDFHCGLLNDDTLDGCIAHCCETAGCVSYSWNAPWTIGPYMECVAGRNCCCLKDRVPPLEPNKWPMNITTGAASQPQPPPFSCNDAMDCNLNGECESGKCRCDAAWRTEDCGELALMPVPADLRGAYQTKVDLRDCGTSCGPSSWGGLPIKGADGRYHLFASQFVQNCTLKGWLPGSTVVRAVSDDPMGPFVYAETVFETFHHNPQVLRLDASQSGTGAPMLVMYMIGGDAAPPAGSGAQCVGTGGTAADPHHLEGYITLAHAPSELGPWTKFEHAILPSGEPGKWDAMVTNPGPLILANGSALLFFRGTNWPIDGYERIGLAKSEGGWRGPYGRLTDAPIWGPVDDQRKFVEDPYAWQSKRGFHLLSHGHFDENGYYACAETAEGPWQFRVAPAYTNVLAVQGGGSATLVQRERPQIFFNASTGAPAILFTGVAPPGGAFYGFTYTHAQRIQQSAA